jgi:hypothetical protein
MTELMILLMVWISGVTGLPIVPPPNIQFVDSSREMIRLAYQCDKPDKITDIAGSYCDHGDDEDYVNNILALYDHRTKTIILNNEWTRKTVKNRAILLHELVHHMQWAAGKGDDYQCRGEVEREAYETQNKWLKDFHNTDIFVVLALGKLYYMTIINCQLINRTSIPPEWDVFDNNYEEDNYDGTG